MRFEISSDEIIITGVRMDPIPWDLIDEACEVAVIGLDAGLGGYRVNKDEHTITVPWVDPIPEEKCDFAWLIQEDMNVRFGFGDG